VRQRRGDRANNKLPDVIFFHEVLFVPSSIFLFFPVLFVWPAFVWPAAMTVAVSDRRHATERASTVFTLCLHLLALVPHQSFLLPPITPSPVTIATACTTAGAPMADEKAELVALIKSGKPICHYDLLGLDRDADDVSLALFE
jgi:hypothetical protein